jgi:diguanylate cyclase (GGDEF)-like protein
MELREYAGIFLRYWWLIIAIPLFALTATLISSYAETPIYESNSTYVTRLNTGQAPDDAVYSLDILMGRERLFVTYCDVMSSKIVFDRAAQLAGVGAADPSILEPYRISCNPLPTSNVLLLTVKGPAPTLVARLNQAIGLAGMEMVNNLYNIFPIQPLDPVALNPDPISPNHTFNAVLGLSLGVIVALTTALLLYYLRSPQENIEALSIRDVRFNLYNKRYFQNRMREEIDRSRAHSRPISVASLRLIPNEDFDLMPEPAQENLVRRAAIFIEDYLRQSDIMTHVSDYTFQVLLPDTPGDEAYNLLTELHMALRAHAVGSGDLRTNFVANSGLVENSGGTLSSGDLTSKAAQALIQADQLGENHVEYVRTTPRPFISGNGNGAGPE